MNVLILYRKLIWRKSSDWIFQYKHFSIIHIQFLMPFCFEFWSSLNCPHSYVLHITGFAQVFTNETNGASLVLFLQSWIFESKDDYKTVMSKLSVLWVCKQARHHIIASTVQSHIGLMILTLNWAIQWRCKIGRNLWFA